jgi:hypothetical protein
MFVIKLRLYDSADCRRLSGMASFYPADRRRLPGMLHSTLPTAAGYPEWLHSALPTAAGCPEWFYKSRRPPGRLSRRFILELVDCGHEVLPACDRTTLTSMFHNIFIRSVRRVCKCTYNNG